jgi:uncharacterized protein (TIGR00290 family)
MRKVALFWSGGKDAYLALDRLRGEGEAVVTLLVTTFDEETGRLPHHDVPIDWISAQAESLDLPMMPVGLPTESSNEVYEQRMMAVVPRLEEEGIDALAAGDVSLEDVREYREVLAQRMGYPILFPLWGEDTRALADRFVRGNTDAVVVSVDETKLSADLVGSRYDAAFLGGLPEGIDPAGEGGEFHTFVFDGPAFRKRLIELGTML